MKKKYKFSEEELRCKIHYEVTMGLRDKNKPDSPELLAVIRGNTRYHKKHHKKGCIGVLIDTRNEETVFCVGAEELEVFIMRYGIAQARIDALMEIDGELYVKDL